MPILDLKQRRTIGTLASGIVGAALLLEALSVQNPIHALIEGNPLIMAVFGAALLLTAWMMNPLNQRRI